MVYKQEKQFLLLFFVEHFLLN